jgi:hypothetical protein
VGRGGQRHLVLRRDGEGGANGDEPCFASGTGVTGRHRHPGVTWVGAFVFKVDPTLPPGGAETDHLDFERVGDRWLIDEIVETWTGRDLDGEGTRAS